LGTEEKRRATFKSSTDETVETLTWNNKIRKKMNQCIREKTRAHNIVKGIKQCHKKWQQNVQRVDRKRIPKQALQYTPKERRNIGRPRKKWGDQLYLED
jgi:hypothetical protein